MLNLIQKDNLQILEIDIDGVITPEILQTLKLPEVDPKKGVIISGRAPIWLYAYLVHELHPTAWVACYDPRLGAVVVATHCKQKQVGTTLDIKV